MDRWTKRGERSGRLPGSEGADAGVTGNSLWPATIIESLASENFELGNKSQWRKATILSDAVMQLVVGWVVRVVYYSGLTRTWL